MDEEEDVVMDEEGAVDDEMMNDVVMSSR